MSLEKNPNMPPDDPILTAEEWDVLSDGYDLESDISIPCYEPRDRWPDAVFPDKYQIPDSCLTPVKRQFTANCWVYAMICCLETYLLLHGIVPSNKGTYADWSEAHVTYDMFDLDHSGPKKNVRGMLPRPPDKSRKYPTYGGNRMCAAAYYSRGNSAVAEITDPCLPHTPKLAPRSPGVGNGKEKKCYVSGYEFMADPMGSAPSRSFIDNIKYCLSAYSSVSISLLWNSKEFMNVETASGKELRSYYTPEKSLIPPTVKTGHHAVSIVGWDDHYSESHFKPACGKQPNAGGAFLCRNSYGTSSDWDGYFWLSYEDENMASPACVREVLMNFFDEPRKVYARASFGMMAGIEQSTAGVEFSVKYTTDEDDEELTHIVLFNLTPCVAEVKLKQTGALDIALIHGKDLSYPGYHTVELSSSQLFSKAGTEFTLSCQYTPYAYGTVLAPCEKHIFRGTQDKFVNIDLQPGTCFVNGKDLYQRKDLYGNIALHAIVKKTGSQGKALKDAFDSLSLPAAAGYRIDNLPSASQGLALEWRIEPAEGTVYMPGSPYNLASFQQYSAGSSRGLINTSTTDAVSGYVTCMIGSGGFAMKKAFPVSLPPYQSGGYSFTVGKVSNGKEVDISGTFPVAGAIVCVSANNADEKEVRTDVGGTWSVQKYSLYKDAWDDRYQNTTIRVTIYDEHKNLVLSSGSASQALEKPFRFDAVGAVATVVVAGCIGVTIGWLIKNFCGSGKAASCGCGGFAFSEHLRGNPYLHLTDAVFGDTGLLDEVGSLENVHLHADRVGGKSQTDFGGLVKKIAKGGYVKNCSVSGVFDAGGGKFGGLFLTGEDVEVSDCVVDISIKNAEECGGIAHTLSGGCKVQNVAVNGSAAGKTVAGLAVHLDGDVEQAVVNLQVEAEECSAGIAKECAANLSQVQVSGAYRASKGSSAGLVVTQQKGTIQDTRIGAEIHGQTAAAGVAAVQSQGAVIRNCYVSGKVVSDAGPAAGIASGVSGEPSAVSACLCVCAEITGTSAARISPLPVVSSTAYDKICVSGGSAPVSGESLRSAEELLKADIYAALGWDTANIWVIDPKKKFPRLNGTAALYDFPFPNPYPTEDEAYTFVAGNSIVLYGAKHIATKKIKWSISSDNALIRKGNPEILLNQDEFYLQLMLAGTGPAVFRLSLASVLDSGEYGVTFPITIV